MTVDALQERADRANELSAVQPATSIALYREVLAAGDDSDEAQKLKEGAIQRLCELYVSQRQQSELASLVRDLRPFFGSIAKAKTAKLVRAIIDALGRIPGSGEAQAALCSETIEWCKAEKRSFLRMRLELKLAALLLEGRKYAPALALVDGLLREGKRLDDKGLLVDIHLLESRVHHALRNLPKARAALTAGRTAAASIYVGPDTQAEIDLQAGTLHADERDYKTAYSYFFEAFEARQTQAAVGKGAAAAAAAAAAASAAAAPQGVGASSSAPAAAPAAPAVASIDVSPVPPLKYMLLCKIMTGSADDVSGIINGKAGVRWAGRGVEAMRAVASAHGHRSLLEFDRALAEFKDELVDDAFIASHLRHLSEQLLEANLARLIEPFSCVEITHIASLIGLPAPRVEAKLGAMILDRKLDGTLDAGRGTLLVFERPPADRAYAAALGTLDSLGTVVDALHRRADALK